MKRIVLIMLIAVSMIITAGAASANTLNLTVDNDDVAAGPNCEEYNVGVTYEGKIMTVEILQPTDADAHLKSIYLNLASSNAVESIVLQDDTEIDFKYGGPAVPNLGTFNMNLTLGKPIEGGPMTKTKVVIIEFTNDIMFTPNAKGFSAAAHIGGLGENGEGSKKLGDGVCGGGGIEEIPEFPTVALPIAAILGLAFFFQRRKE